MIVFSHDIVVDHLQEHDLPSEFDLTFVSVDNGDVFISTHLAQGAGHNRQLTNGLLRFEQARDPAQTEDILDGYDVLVVIQLVEEKVLSMNGWVRVEGRVEERPVQTVPMNEALFERVQGLYETDVLHSKTALIVGLGSGGSLIAVELAKAGVGSFALVDHDRLELGNVVRHICGISDIGRFKTKAVRDLILDKNPNAQVTTFEEVVDWDWLPTLGGLVAQADIVFCCTDNRPSRMVVNSVTVSKDRVCLYAGVFRRAYGGQVVRVTPKESMCYQCYIDIMPEIEQDQEVSSQEQAVAAAYADRPVPVEPGLANDIAPVVTMCVKLGILEMLRGTETTLESLYEDLTSPGYLWLNRREADTQYADLKPMDTGGEDFRILAWYGMEIDRDPKCPICGEFVDKALSRDKIAQFMENEGDHLGGEAPPSRSKE